MNKTVRIVVELKSNDQEEVALFSEFIAKYEGVESVITLVETGVIRAKKEGGQIFFEDLLYDLSEPTIEVTKPSILERKVTKRLVQIIDS